LGHGVSETTQLGVPISNYVEIKNNIDFICSELEKLELASSLASAKNLKSVIYNEVTIQAAAEMPIAPEARALSGEWAVLGADDPRRYKNYAKDLVNRFSDELSTRIVVSISLDTAKYLNKRNAIRRRRYSKHFLIRGKISRKPENVSLSRDRQQRFFI